MKRNRVARLAGIVCLAMLTGGAMAGAQVTQGNPQSPGPTGNEGTRRVPGDTGMPPGAAAPGSSNSNVIAADRKFVKEAMEGGLAEVQLGQLAAQKAGSEDVKQFGQKMTEDHGKLNEQMKTVAGQLGLTPPTTLDGKHKAIQAKLEGLSGDAFDKAYIQAMVKDHQNDSAEFQKEASSGKTPAVKDAAAQGERVISEHLKMIEKIARDHGMSGGKTANAQ